MMKKLFFTASVIFSFNLNSLFALDAVSLGLSGGVNIGFTDFDREAMFEWQSLYAPEWITGVELYPSPMQSVYSPAVNAALTVGIDFNKRFSFSTGLGLFLNISDNLMFTLYKIEEETTGTTDDENAEPAVKSVNKYVYKDLGLNYTYSFLTIPLNFNFYLLNKPHYRLGIGFGPYFSIPLGDVSVSRDTESGAGSLSIEPEDYTIPQSWGAGIQAGLLNQFNIKNFAITLDITYTREFFGGIDPLVIEQSFFGKTSVGELTSHPEKKMSVFQAVSVTVGVKYLFKSKKSPLPAAAVEEPEDSGRLMKSVKAYYIGLGNQAEGPYSLDDLTKLAGEGVFKTDTQVWKSGQKDWQDAKELEELNEVFENR